MKNAVIAPVAIRWGMGLRICAPSIPLIIDPHSKLSRVLSHDFCRTISTIETVIDQLKNISQIEHSRHRSPVNFGVNVLCGLIAYCYQPKKPSLNLEQDLAKYA